MNISTDSHRANIGELPERRGTSRFPVQQDVRYRVIQDKNTQSSGCGATLNIGSAGILFTTEAKLALGSMVELSVNWPVRLGGTCPLQFVASGPVVRSESDKAAVRIEKYEFKTRSMQSSTVAS